MDEQQMRDLKQAFKSIKFNDKFTIVPTCNYNDLPTENIISENTYFYESGTQYFIWLLSSVALSGFLVPHV